MHETDALPLGDKSRRSSHNLLEHTFVLELFVLLFGCNARLLLYFFVDIKLKWKQ